MFKHTVLWRHSHICLLLTLNMYGPIERLPFNDNCRHLKKLNKSHLLMYLSNEGQIGLGYDNVMSKTERKIRKELNTSTMLVKKSYWKNQD
jgi:hypothetical protein